jgi:hypothetical protein
VAERPLQGTRIVVTRPESRPLAEALEGLGAEVSIVPLIEIRPVEDPRALDAAVADLATYDWVVFTSINGVAAVGERLSGIGETRVAAVGPVTADSVRALGVRQRYRCSGLGGHRGRTGIDRRRSCTALTRHRGSPARHELERGGYRRHGRGLPHGQLEPSSGSSPATDGHAIVSPAGRRFAARVDRGSLGLGRPTLLVCIGPKTAAVAREVGLPVGLVADETTADGIIRALVSRFGESS